MANNLSPAFQTAFETFQKQANVQKQKSLEEEAASLSRRGVLSSPYGTQPLQDIRTKFDDIIASQSASLGVQQATAETEQARFDKTFDEKVRQFDEGIALQKEQAGTQKLQFQARLDFDTTSLKQNMTQFLSKLGFDEDALGQSGEEFTANLDFLKKKLASDTALQQEYNDAVSKGQGNQWLLQQLIAGYNIADDLGIIDKGKDLITSTFGGDTPVVSTQSNADIFTGTAGAEPDVTTSAGQGGTAGTTETASVDAQDDGKSNNPIGDTIKAAGVAIAGYGLWVKLNEQIWGKTTPEQNTKYRYEAEKNYWIDLYDRQYEPGKKKIKDYFREHGVTDEQMLIIYGF